MKKNQLDLIKNGRLAGIIKFSLSNMLQIMPNVIFKENERSRGVLGSEKLKLD